MLDCIFCILYTYITVIPLVLPVLCDTDALHVATVTSMLTVTPTTLRTAVVSKVWPLSGSSQNTQAALYLFQEHLQWPQYSVHHTVMPGRLPF